MDRVSRLSYRLQETFRHSSLLDVARRTGLEAYFHAAYWSVFPMLIDEEHTATVGGVEAEFDVATPAERKLLVTSRFHHEERVIRALLSDVRATDTFWDVGAQFGAFTCFVGRTLTGGEVVAFEPGEHKAERLARNAHRNGADATIVRHALSDTSEDVGFNLTEGCFDADAGTAVPVVTATELIESGRVPPPDVVKIDVEGAEGRVLRGMGPALESTRVVYCELHDDTGEIRGLLEGAGMTCERLDLPDRSQGYLRGSREA